MTHYEFAPIISVKMRKKLFSLPKPNIFIATHLNQITLSGILKMKHYHLYRKVENNV